MNKHGHIELANFFVEPIKFWRIERNPFDLRRDRNSFQAQASDRSVDFLKRFFAFQDWRLGEPNKLSWVFRLHLGQIVIDQTALIQWSVPSQ